MNIIPKYLILLVASATIVGCSSDDKGHQADGESATLSAKLTEQEAKDQSPTGDICIEGEIEQVFVPSNRGRGNNNGEWVTVDNRTFEPAFLRGDVNYDGQVGTRDDAMLATKNIYVKQIEKEACPAVADIGTFPQGLSPDGFFTAEDIHLWGEIKRSGVYPLERELICLSDCSIINHQSPEYKGNK